MGGRALPNTINNRQLVFVLLITLTAITLISLPRTMADAAEVGGWFTILITALVYATAAAIIVYLNCKFQGEVLFDYSARLVGKVGSYAIGIYYMLYFLLNSAYLCAGMANVLVSDFFIKTPAWFTIALGMPFYGYTAYKGVTTIARLFEIIGLLFLLAILAMHIVMLFQGRVENILPLFVPEDIGRYLSAIRSALLSFLGVEVLTLMPIAQKSRKRAPLVAFLAVIGIALLYILVVESCIMMIGLNEIKNNNCALITAIRQIQIPLLDFLERIDFVYLTFGFMGLYGAKAVVLLAVVEYACKIFTRIHRGLIVLAACVIIFLVDLVLLDINELGHYFEGYGLIFGNIAAVGIPLLLFFLSKVKKRAIPVG